MNTTNDVGEIIDPAVARFQARFIPNANDKGCWYWIGYRDSGGYGQFYYHGRILRAHQVSYILRFGDIPEGKKVLHSCNHPECVNPAHLSAGTQRENIDYMVSQGRQCHGERHPRTKLTAVQVADIRRLHTEGVKVSALAKMYPIKRRGIYDILNGINWREGFVEKQTTG